MRRLFLVGIFIILKVNQISAQQGTVVDKNIATDVSKQTDKGDGIKEGWSRGASFNTTFNQTQLSNWFSGGDRKSLGISGQLQANLKYKKKNTLFKTNVDAAFGMLNTTSTGGFRKTDDRWVLTTSINHKVKKNIYYTLAAQLKSQFTRGYTYTKEGTRTLISEFLSPGDAKLGLGMTYQRGTKLSVYLSPITAKVNVKTSNQFYSQKIFGVDSFKRVAVDLGCFTRIDFKTELKKDLIYTSSIDAFYGYILKNYNVYWANLFNWKLNKYFGLTFSVDIAYDNTQPTPNYTKDASGKEIILADANGEIIKTVKWQYKQFFGLGFNYSL